MVENQDFKLRSVHNKHLTYMVNPYVNKNKLTMVLQKYEVLATTQKNYKVKF